MALKVNFRVVNSALRVRTSVGEGAVALEMVAYPNPFSETLYLEIKSAVRQPVVVSCYDAKGSQVGRMYEGQLEAGREHLVELDGRSWQDGLYFLRVTTRQQQLVKKVTLLRK